MQDIIPPKKRSIRDIPLPEGKNRIVEDYEKPIKKPTKISQEEDVEFIKPQSREVNEIKRNFVREEVDNEDEGDEEEFEPVRERKTSNRSSKKISKKKAVLFSVLAFAFVFVLLIVSREGAKVYVYAKEVTQSTNLSIGLDYTPLELSSEKSVSIKATGEEKVTEKAKGRITIYNEYEEEDQRLLKDTRFESPQGLIYRIPSSVVVPGLKRDEKGNVVPGKIEVEVVAGEVGEKYNVGASKFTVPGFKDLPQYSSFYAQSTNSIEGGFDGVRKVISDSDRQDAEKTIKNQLKEELINTAKSKTTAENLVLADESMIVYEILGDKVDGDNVSITARGKISAASFNFVEFSNSIAKSLIPTFSDTENVVIKNINDLNISLSKSPIEETKVNLDLAGSVEFVWKNNPTELAEILSGTDKTKINEKMEMFPGIEKISAEVSPFWKKTFPEDPSRIKIIDSKN